ncbi:nitrate reductase [Thiomicrorhabdus heinhorstiae]|uniref:Molybdopterin-dependent oxidoreductase n=1 Tax=Thiomicrorhabdus heinhorstiae TaxID=2748010 RepID=A0ABS0BY43_9GAMM|nr:nitrate reductase [Thiomicrorhabdus heinhorstiae]MBF6058710.1 molybdopterin-dependent oxidoreductase [Thiomicrorhabdus heinhorstiae]
MAAKNFSSFIKTSIKSSVKTTCPYCGVGCGMLLSPNPTMQSGWDLSGDKTHPANFGRLCVKGASAAETLGFEGRLLSPQINGQEADWETALNEVAGRFKKIIDQYGPESVAFYVSGQLLTEDYYVANKLMKGFIGSANIDTNSRLCMASAVVGYKRAFGSDSVPCSYEDLEQAELITLVGSNTAWAHPIVYQRIAAAKKANPQMKVVVVDPRRTATCDLADLHLAIKPGMDAALFNGLLAYFSEHGEIDVDFVARHCNGFAEALDAARQQADIQELAELCDLAVEDLHQWFEWCLQSPKMLTLYSQGVNQSTSGVDKSNAIINCHLATGRIGKVGCGPFSITGQPNAMGGREVGGLANQLAAHMDFTSEESIDRVARFWQAQNMATQDGLKAVDMFDAIAAGKIKAIWIMNTNPVVSMPDADRVRQALLDCETVVVSDCMAQTDTTEVADILLPALTWGETDGSVTNSDRTISMQRAFISGPEQSRADWWMICEVAKRMGFGEAFEYRHPVEIFREHAALSAFENDETGTIRDFNLAALTDISLDDYLTFPPTPWPIVDKDARGKPLGTPRLFCDGQFFTSDRKARFIAITPRAPQSSPNPQYPFVLNTGRVRDQWHTMTRTAKTPKLMTHVAEPFVAIHPQDAEEKGLTNGGLARVFNDLGELILRVECQASQRRGGLFVPMHWNRQYASHANVDRLVAARVDPLSGQPESKHAVVAVEAYHSSWKGFVLSRDSLEQAFLEGLYWSRITGEQFQRYEVEAQDRSARSWMDCLQSAMNGNDSTDWLRYVDETEGVFRLAMLQNGKLQLAVFVSKDKLPERRWVGQCFSQEVLSERDRRFLLAGKLSGAKDAGKTICSCFGVGLNTILEAIETQSLTSVEEIGKALKAGTNCGSCLPELTEILQSQYHELRA